MRHSFLPPPKLLLDADTELLSWRIPARLTDPMLGLPAIEGKNEEFPEAGAADSLWLLFPYMVEDAATSTPLNLVDLAFCWLIKAFLCC